MRSILPIIASLATLALKASAQNIPNLCNPEPFGLANLFFSGVQIPCNGTVSAAGQYLPVRRNTPLTHLQIPRPDQSSASQPNSWPMSPPSTSASLGISPTNSPMGAFPSLYTGSRPTSSRPPATLSLQQQPRLPHGSTQAWFFPATRPILSSSSCSPNLTTSPFHQTMPRILPTSRQTLPTSLVA